MERLVRNRIFQLYVFATEGFRTRGKITNALKDLPTLVVGRIFLANQLPPPPRPPHSADPSPHPLKRQKRWKCFLPITPKPKKP